MAAKMAAKSPPPFSTELIRWQKKHGRHNLPWQNTRAPYNIWVSETMLQQTQTTTVAPYYEKFLRRFPNIGVLARAREESVLALWRGLGYYARARHLHRAAKIIEREHGGIFPQQFADIVKLPGVGRSTAAAIAVFAFGRRLAILDGNVKRVLARYYAVSTAIDEAATITRLWQLSEAAVPARADIRAYTQGLMDLGASLCTRRPHCIQCPLASACAAYKGGFAENLPVRRRREKPTRRLAMALVLAKDGGKILLQKRPATGIWGGLWSLPEFMPPIAGDDNTSDLRVRRAAQSLLGIKLSLASENAVLRCEFTHYSLIADIVFLKATTTASLDGTSFRWLATKHLSRTALPEPVYRFLRQRYYPATNSKGADS